MNNSSHFSVVKTAFYCFCLLFSTTFQTKAQLNISVKDTIATCEGANFKIIASSNAGAGAIFSWQGPNGYTSVEKDASITNLTKDRMGVYTVTVSAGVQIATATSLVKPNAIEVAVIGGFTSVCVGENLRLRDIVLREPNEQPLTYFWTGPDNYTSTASRTDIPTTEDLRQVGEYTLTETYENGCVVKASLTPTVTKCLSIGDLVWDDKNNNALLDTGETGIGNVTVKLYKAKLQAGLPSNTPDGNAIKTTLTDPLTGKYLFPELVPGFYIVEIEAPADYKPSGGSNAPPINPNNDVNNDNNGTAFQGQIIRTNFIELANFGEPQNDGDTTNGTNADKNSNLTIDFGLFKVECPAEPKCIPFVAKKSN
ncbi:MAG: hypothetical protein MUF58_10270 [Arcicella sp.]|jgi:hypothetical protein|nr:hypothetical protein [Arcicella sp.]